LIQRRGLGKKKSRGSRSFLLPFFDLTPEGYIFPGFRSMYCTHFVMPKDLQPGIIRVKKPEYIISIIILSGLVDTPAAPVIQICPVLPASATSATVEIRDRHRLAGVHSGSRIDPINEQNHCNVRHAHHPARGSACLTQWLGLLLVGLRSRGVHRLRTGSWISAS
jgi:hypothetical protein